MVTVQQETVNWQQLSFDYWPPIGNYLVLLWFLSMF